MPDHPIRHTRWWQMFVRLPRPALEWVTVGGIGYALIIGPAIQRPLGDGYLSQALLFAGGLFGVRAFEKVKGVRWCVRTRNLRGSTMPCGSPPYHRTTFGTSSLVDWKRVVYGKRVSGRVDLGGRLLFIIKKQILI